MSLKQKTNDIINEMDIDLKIAEEELTKDFDDEDQEDAEFESLEDEEEEEEEDKEIKRTTHGKPSPYAPKNGRAPHLHHLYANYGGEVMPYINMFDLQLSYETSDIELLYHLCERINKMIDIINAENKYINRLTDWTEKKIHKLFKHQKKFENYLLELLDEFKEEMNEKFSEFKEEINQEIKDFEDLVNEELESMNAEINRFENEMKERADAFEESMKERADAFEESMKERADAFEKEVNQKLDDMDKEIASFENEMKLRADNFENSINNEMSTFETEMRNRASEFEETIEKEQSNYESEMNTRADNFETSVNQSINDFKTETTNEINEFESLVNSTINDFSTDWTTKLNDFETYINHHIEEFESAMDERADSFETNLKEEWNDFKEKFSDMYNEYINDITNQWNEFKNEMSEEWTSEKESLENEMNSYEETMNQNYNEFKESIENYISECCENVQNEINSFEETVNKMIDDFENDYNERLETTTKEEVDAKIEDIVNQSIYELIQQSEEFRNAISNVVNQLLEESETLKEMITSIVEKILSESEELNKAIATFFDENFNSYLSEYLEDNETLLSIINDAVNSACEECIESDKFKNKVTEIVDDMEMEGENNNPYLLLNRQKITPINLLGISNDIESKSCGFENGIIFTYEGIFYIGYINNDGFFDYRLLLGDSKKNNMSYIGCLYNSKKDFEGRNNYLFYKEENEELIHIYNFILYEDSIIYNENEIGYISIPSEIGNISIEWINENEGSYRLYLFSYDSKMMMYDDFNINDSVSYFDNNEMELPKTEIDLAYIYHDYLFINDVNTISIYNKNTLNYLTSFDYFTPIDSFKYAYDSGFSNKTYCIPFSMCFTDNSIIFSIKKDDCIYNFVYYLNNFLYSTENIMLYLCNAEKKMPSLRILRISNSYEYRLLDNEESLFSGSLYFDDNEINVTIEELNYIDASIQFYTFGHSSPSRNWTIACENINNSLSFGITVGDDYILNLYLSNCYIPTLGRNSNDYFYFRVEIYHCTIGSINMCSFYELDIIQSRVLTIDTTMFDFSNLESGIYINSSQLYFPKAITITNTSKYNITVQKCFIYGNKDACETIKAVSQASDNVYLTIE